jgi:4-hydroxy-3-polyprenylbenzoate decarboxylase
MLRKSTIVNASQTRPSIARNAETPLHAGHLKSMHELALYGATILPPVPGFYILPKTIDDLVDHSVGKALDQLGVAHELFPRWTGVRR